LPEFDRFTVEKLLSLLHCFQIVGSIDVNWRSGDVLGGRIQAINAIECHFAVPASLGFVRRRLILARLTGW